MIPFEIIPVVCGKQMGEEVVVERIPFVMMRPIEEKHLTKFCSNCSLFHSYSANYLNIWSYVHHPDNCVLWLCNDGECPHDKEISDMKKGKENAPIIRSN
jgi:hypothetical protein